MSRDAAHDAAMDRIALTVRDADVPLSDLGREQASALGHWFSGQAEEDRPEVLLSPPYCRALQTAEIFRGAGGAPAEVPICFDEHLREKEFGILDGLTTRGVANLFPEQAEFRRLLGKFYHRPPGEEMLVFAGGCIGLATGGSGDVLAGLIGGLAARRASPVQACAWAAYIHGAAGRALSRKIGTVGFLARELLPLIPRLIDENDPGGTGAR